MFLEEKIYSIFDENVIAFFSSRDPYFEFSNMAANFPIRYKGQTWRSTEHLYQASKYSKEAMCVPESNSDADPFVRQRIFNSNNAMGAKMTQKCAVKAGLVRADWNDVSVRNMKYVLQLKLQQHKNTFGKVLLSTGDKVIVEKSRKDPFWGAVPYMITMLKGSNVLGQLLTAVRDDYDAIVRGDFDEPELFMID